MTVLLECINLNTVLTILKWGFYVNPKSDGLKSIPWFYAMLTIRRNNLVTVSQSYGCFSTGTCAITNIKLLKKYHYVYPVPAYLLQLKYPESSDEQLTC